MMGHLNIENIMTYLDGTATDTEKFKMEAHLAICAVCSESKGQTEAIERLLHEEADFQTPAHLVQSLKDLFPAGPTAPAPARPFLAQIIASLGFDSFNEPMLSGVRTPAAPPRQRVFSAGDIDVDVKIELAKANRCITLTGQVMSDVSNFIQNAVVRLESDGMVHYRTRTNEMGEFSFEVPNDAYDLSIEVNGQRIAILDVHKDASNS
jgi:hypothetical protein